MLHNLAVGLPVMLVCLLLQAVFVAVCLRYYVRFKHARQAGISMGQEILLLTVVMVMTLFGNFVQMAIWAMLFMVLGEFGDFATALYHSGVNFATLGYGDIVMSPTWRLLGPLEAANGILMFGVSSSVMTAAVLDVVKYNLAGPGRDGGP
ncbi:ion channel [Cupriavidus neocaledonicus]|uniref:Ion channel n=1 Tax=Cupriavidus neocaledonicus TaxID=1040979 RepID=A0A375HAE1_9BURK|nr:ion channel [Cupriavidus neocaledonicus]SOZ35313.1 putative membrane lipoprotein [Cupriavidus neocaledonicus]SPD47259.1 Ion channel [Cupriavidus neocaledonicus]